MRRYAFALRPKWIFGHILVVVLAVTFINLGFWQIRRLHQREAFNHTVRTNQALAVAGFTNVVPTGSGHGVARHNQGRRVVATGTYESNRSMVIRGQSVNSNPGVWIVTPLLLDDHTAVLVNRGFYANDGSLTAPPKSTAPPTGVVTVRGTVQPTETAGVFEHRDPASPSDNFARMDIDRIQHSVPQPLAAGWILQTGQTPRDPGTQLQPVPPPVLSNGPHLSYTIQWFSFTAIGLIGYPILLRRKARDLAEEAKRAAEGDGADGAGGDAAGGDGAHADGQGAGEADVSVTSGDGGDRPREHAASGQHPAARANGSARADSSSR